MSNDLTAEDKAHLGGHGDRQDDLLGEGFVGVEELVGAEEIIGAARYGSHTNSTDLERTGKKEAYIGAARYGSHTNSTDLERTGKKEAYIGGARYGSQTNSTTLERTAKGRGVAYIGTFVGSSGGPSSAERTKAMALHRKMQEMAKARQEIPVVAVTAYLDAVARAYSVETKRAMPKGMLEGVRQDLYATLADLGGKVRGQVSGMGNWFSSLAKGTGKVIGKTTEFGVRAAKGVVWDVPKAGFTAVKALTYTPAKDTFFPGGGKKSSSSMARPVAAASAATAASALAARRLRLPAPVQSTDAFGSPADIARRIAAKQANIKARKAAAEGKMLSAQKMKQLEDAEAADEAAVAELEAQAATAEAEAEATENASEADAEVDGDDMQEVTDAASAIKKDKATQQRIAKGVAKAAGPYAKAALFASPFGMFAKFAQQVYKEAKVDPDAPKKVQELRDAAAKGNEKAQVALKVLETGKKTDEELVAATLAHKDLATEAVKSAGGEAVAGLVPSTSDLVGHISGATSVCCLARQGNPAAVQAVVKGANLLNRSVAGDASARQEITGIRDAASKGNALAKASLAALGVAAAGMREQAHVDAVRREFLRGQGAAALGAEVRQKAAAAMVAKPTAPKPNPALAKAAATIAKTIGPASPMAHAFHVSFGQRYTEGLAIKTAQRARG